MKNGTTYSRKGHPVLNPDLIRVYLQLNTYRTFAAASFGGGGRCVVTLRVVEATPDVRMKTAA